MLCPSEHMTVLRRGPSIPPGSFSLGEKLFHWEAGGGEGKSPCASPRYLSGDGLTRL